MGQEQSRQQAIASLQAGDIVRALHPELQIFCRATFISRRRVIYPTGAQYVTRVRWCHAVTQEPDYESVVNDESLLPATLPKNDHINVKQIIQTPFPIHPRYSEIFYSPPWVENGLYMPGFIQDENEFQYCVHYSNKYYKPLNSRMRATDIKEARSTKMQKAREKEHKHIKHQLKLLQQNELILNDKNKEHSELDDIREESLSLDESSRASIPSQLMNVDYGAIDPTLIYDNETFEGVEQEEVEDMLLEIERTEHARAKWESEDDDAHHQAVQRMHEEKTRQNYDELENYQIQTYIPEYHDEPQPTDEDVLPPEQEIEDESNPKWLQEWVNKYSTRIKLQTSFWNVLYGPYLQADYKPSANERLFMLRAQFDTVQLQLLNLENARKNKSLAVPQNKKTNEELELEKQRRRLQKEINKVLEKSSLSSEMEWTLEIESRHAELLRKHRYNQVVTFNREPMTVTDRVGPRSSHDASSSSSNLTQLFAKETQNISVHQRRTHPLDNPDQLWETFMSESWLRFLFHYKDPEATHYNKGANFLHSPIERPSTDSSNSSSLAGNDNVPILKKWIWAQVQSKTENDITLALFIPSNLRKFGVRILHKHLTISYGVSGHLDKVVMFRSYEDVNRQFIRYYDDRIRRWQIDSYRRYYLFLAKQGLQLIVINRVAAEMNEFEHDEEILLELAEYSKKQNSDTVMSVSNTSNLEEMMATALSKANFTSTPKTPLTGASSSRALTTAVSSNVSRRNSRLFRPSFHHLPSVNTPKKFAFHDHHVRPSQATGLAGLPPPMSVRQMFHLGDSYAFETSTPSSSSSAALSAVPGSKIAAIGTKQFVSNEAYGVVGYDDMKEDGNSIYRAVSLQLFGTQENFLFLKQLCIKHIATHSGYYANFLDINFEYYLSTKQRSLDPSSEVLSPGDHLDLQAICEIYDVAIEVYSQVDVGDTREQPIISMYTQINSDGSFLNQPRSKVPCYDLPIIRLSYAGNGHYDACKKVGIIWPLESTMAKGFPVYMRTKMMNIVLNARKKQQQIEIEIYRVEEARRSYLMIQEAIATAPLPQSHNRRKQLKSARNPKPTTNTNSEEKKEEKKEDSNEGDTPLEISMINYSKRHATYIQQPLDMPKLDFQRSLLSARELVLCTYIGPVLFQGNEEVQTMNFVDLLASANINHGNMPDKYSVHQTFTQMFWHDMHFQDLAEFVSKENLEGLAAIAMFSTEDGSANAATITGEGLRLNLPRIMILYPYFPHDAHLEVEERYNDHHRTEVEHAPLMLIEGIQNSVEEFVRLVKKMSRSNQLVRTSLATWLPAS